MRGMYRPDQLPDSVYEKRRGRIKVNLEGFVLCDDNNQAGFPCSNPAVNRSLKCRNHGGALHPCDKKLSPATNQLGLMAAAEGQAAIEKLDRVQRFMQGFLTVEDLDDDEIVGGYVRDSNGVPINNQRIGVRFQQDMVKELARRMNKFLQMKLPNMLKVMTDIAESDIVEPQDRIKAAIWCSERVMGKTPDVVIHGTTGKPYESIFENLESGSREAYRINSSRPIESGAEIFDAETIEVGTDEDFAEVEEISERDDSAEITGNGVRSFVGRQDVAETTDQSEAGSILSNESDISELQVNDYSQKPPDKIEKYVTLEQQRAEAKSRRDRIKKAKSRRFAARAAGAPTVANTPWLVDWRARKGGLWCAKIIPADAQTPTLLAKLEAKKSQTEKLEEVKHG